jgi:iron complex transport system substrate-binding protein
VNLAARRTRFAVAIISMALLASACAVQDESEAPDDAGSFTGADGVTSDTSDISRIVTLSGDLAEFVFELGAGDSVVATDLTTVYPNEAAILPKVGVGRFLSAEAVLAHDPTLVIGDTQTAPQIAIDQIRAAGVPVVIFDVSTTFEIMYAKAEHLGAMLGAADEASVLVQRMRTDITAVTSPEDAPASLPTVAYVYTRGPDVMLLFGKGMVTNPVILSAGATDAGLESGVEGSIPVTPEALIAASPDVLVVPEEGLAALGGIDGLLAIPGISETPAGLNRRILAYPEGDFLTLGPRIPTSVALLAQDLTQFFDTP